MANAPSDSPSSSLGQALFKMTWPMLFGVLALMSFQLADSAFIGQLGVAPLAVAGFTVPVYLFISGTQVGLGIATTAVISRTLGSGDRLRAGQLGGLVMWTGALMILALCLLIWLLRKPIVTAMGADASLLPLVDRYWAPWLLSTWLGAVLYFGYSLCRAHSNTKLPGLTMVGISLLNIALDPLYIFTFGWGIAGAAWASCTAFAVGCLIIFPRLLQRRWLRLNLSSLALRPALKQLGGIMAPAMLSQLMPPLAALLATSLVAGFGTAAVAAWGLGTRLEFFSIVVVLALTMSLPPMVGHFLGAGKIEHIRHLVRIAVRFVIAWQLSVALFWLLVSEPLTQLLTRDPTVRSILQDYLILVPFSYSALGVCMLMVSVSNAMNQPLRGLLISVCRLFLCYLPLLGLGAWLADLTGLFSGALLGNLAAGILAWLLYRQGMKQLLANQHGSLAISEGS